MARETKSDLKEVQPENAAMKTTAMSDGAAEAARIDFRR